MRTKDRAAGTGHGEGRGDGFGSDKAQTADPVGQARTGRQAGANRPLSLPGDTAFSIAGKQLVAQAFSRERADLLEQDRRRPGPTR
jgi:hypothetical protein